MLPSNLVMLYTIEYLNTDNPNRYLEEVERGFDYIVFRTLSTFTSSSVKLWQFLASPFSAPRSLIPYSVL